jgi:hypothetical protein
VCLWSRHDGWSPNAAAAVSGMAAITGPMYQLYIFFMITDPKTTV